MLQNLHVKNLALIDEAEVDFSGGLNILTGETGAGKSIILGSVSLALGGRYSADMLRKGADKGLVELTFYVESTAYYDDKGSGTEVMIAFSDSENNAVTLPLWADSRGVSLNAPKFAY